MNYDLVSSPKRRAAMRNAIINGTPFPDATALGSMAGPDVHQLMIHFNRDDEMNCILLNEEDVVFISDLYTKVLDNPRYRPSATDLLTVRALNLKLAMSGK